MTFSSGTERKEWYIQKKKELRNEQKRKSWKNNKDKYSESRKVEKKPPSQKPESVRKRNQRAKEKHKSIKERDRKRAYREKKKRNTIQVPRHATEINSPFKDRMSRWRALKKVKEALPKTPVKRATILSAYTRLQDSPTIKILQDMDIINSPEEKLEHEVNASIVKNLQNVISSTIKQRSKNASTVMNVLATSVSSEKINQSRASRSLGLNNKRLSKGKKQRTSILKSDTASWKFSERQTRSDAISTEDKKLIYDFWTSSGISRPTGNKNDTKRVRTGPKQFIVHDVYILDKTQTEIYLDFKQKYPQLKVSQRTFEKLKPFFVQSVRPKDRETCCCRYHVEVRSIFRSCMDLRRKLIRENPDLEQGIKVYENLTDLINDTLCVKNSNDNA